MLIFRTEASAKTGFGHLKRSAYLASLLKKNTELIFCIPTEKAAARFLEERRLPFINLKNLSDVTENDLSAIIFDLREFTPADLQLINQAREKNAATIQLTDLGLSQQPVDYTFDGSLELLFPYDPNRRVFQGPQYMPLHHSFRHFNKARRVYRRNIRNVFVSLGGAAQYRHLRRLIDILSRHGFQIKIAPGYYLKKNSIKTLRRIYPKLRFVGKTESLARSFYEADVALITSGVAAAEAAAAGTPSLCFYCHDEQKFIAHSWQKHGAGLAISKIDEIEEGALLDTIRSLSAEKRTEMGAIGKRLSDGGGAMRIIAFLKEKEIIR